MTKIDKLLARIRNNPKNVTFEELRTLLEAYGFEFLHARGSHYSFQGIVGGKSIKVVIPYRRPNVNVEYVKTVLEYIERILEEGEQ
jgi:predicted RNA binding protein YcfA (HicA-like mRNA interferase family)